MAGSVEIWNSLRIGSVFLRSIAYRLHSFYGPRDRHLDSWFYFSLAVTFLRSPKSVALLKVMMSRSRVGKNCIDECYLIGAARESPFSRD